MCPAYTTEQVQGLLYETGRTRMAQSVAGCWPSGYRTGMPEALRDPEDLRYAEAEWTPPQPTTAQCTLADRVDEWIRRMPAASPVDIRTRKIVLDRRLVDPRTDQPKYSWRRLAEMHGLDPFWTKSVWIAGVDRVTAIANRSVVQVQVGTVARIRAASLRPLPGPCSDTLRRIQRHQPAAPAVARAEMVTA